MLQIRTYPLRPWIDHGKPRKVSTFVVPGTKMASVQPILSPSRSGDQCWSCQHKYRWLYSEVVEWGGGWEQGCSWHLPKHEQDEQRSNMHVNDRNPHSPCSTTHIAHTPITPCKSRRAAPPSKTTLPGDYHCGPNHTPYQLRGMTSCDPGAPKLDHILPPPPQICSVSPGRISRLVIVLIVCRPP